jgi:hypothetical protein
MQSHPLGKYRSPPHPFRLRGVERTANGSIFLVIFSIYDIDKDGNITKADLLKVIASQ